MSVEIKLRSNFRNTQTPLSNRFIDEYMTSANGEYVKIYIYLLRQMYSSQNVDLSLAAIADHFDCPEKDIRRALSYWEKSHLLQLGYDADHQLESIQLLDCADSSFPSSSKGRNLDTPKESDSSASFSSQDKESDISAEEQQLLSRKTIHEAASRVLSGIPRTIEDISNYYTTDQLLRFSEEESTKQLFVIVQQYTGKTLNQMDLRILLFWLDELHFPNELIYFLIDYCISRHHNNINYMNKVAINWAENGVQTVEDARRYNETYNELTTAVMRSFGLSGRTLGEKELAYVTTWSRTYGFDKDIIAEACNRTLLATHQASFEYADSILTKWFKKGVKKLVDVGPLDAQHQKRVSAKASSTSASNSSTNGSKNRFNNFDQRSYNDAALEAALTNL